MNEFADDIVKALLGGGAAGNAGETAKLKRMYDLEQIDRLGAGAPPQSFEEWAQEKFGIADPGNTFRRR